MAQKWRFPNRKRQQPSIYEFRALDLSEKHEIEFEQFEGQVLLIVNVASFWSLTHQYSELNALQSRYKKHGFRVLGVPCNQFGHQEPGATESEILNSLRFVRPGNNFKPNFQLLAKCDVNGVDEIGLYGFLKAGCPPPSDEFNSAISSLAYSPLKASDVRWNFEKFLVNKRGQVAMRVHHKTDPSELAPFIEALINDLWNL
jgi:glutathione peroxidase